MKMKKAIFLIAAIAAVFFLAAVISPKLIEYLVTQRLDLIEVAVARRSLSSRTIISKEDVSVIQIPSAYLNEAAYQNAQDVIGKLVVRNGFVPEGSLFYYEAIEDTESASDAAVLDLEEDQVLYALETNLVSLGANALSAGQKVDLYVTLENEQREKVVGILLSNVRILGIKDHKGFDLDDAQSSKTPHVIQFAIDKSALAIVQMASEKGQISYYATGTSYTAQDECVIEWDSAVLNMLGFEKEKAIEG